MEDFELSYMTANLRLQKALTSQGSVATPDLSCFSNPDFIVPPFPSSNEYCCLSAQPTNLEIAHKVWMTALPYRMEAARYCCL